MEGEIMQQRSHVDINKIKTLPEGAQFEYRDVVQKDFPTSQHGEDGALFNKEVESGVYDNVAIANENDEHCKYRKTKYQ
jgi:hypothetical protein